MRPKTFAQVLAYSEMAVGAALLTPMVSSALAGAALTGFGSALIVMYLNTPSMTLEDGLRPSQEGTSVAKDVWLVGAGLTLLSQGLVGAARAEATSMARGTRKAVAGASCEQPPA